MYRIAALILLLISVVSSQYGDVDWMLVGRTPKDTQVTLNFALTQFNLDILESTILDVSDPKSSNYGKWWTAEAIAELVAPPRAVSQSIASFLRAQGANAVEDRRDSVKFVARAEVVEKLLDIELYQFQYEGRADKIITRAIDDYLIPEEISEHVDFISGLYEFPKLPTVHATLADQPEAGVDGLIIPDTIFSLYQIPTAFPVHPNSTMCLAEFLNADAYLASDLQNFAKETDTPVITVKHTVGNFTGSMLESSLDIEYGGATALNTSLWFWSENGWMYDFAVNLLATPNPPLVVSMSWGWPEPKQCGRVLNCSKGESSYEYVQRTNVEFQKLGLLGITLLASSGDQGAPGDLNIDCSWLGSNVFSSIFPGASPWVLSVGATMLTNSSEPVHTPPICAKYGCATSTTELVCTYPKSLITSGGGFSDYSPLPTWQQANVASYLKNPDSELPPSRLFNATNRGFPDVAALGHNFAVCMDGGWSRVDGTSASTPIWGAIVALLNSYRLNHNKPPLGFIPPLIYQAYAADPTIFNDITTGNNKCTEACCDKYGYEATTGWDPVTGLGTPIFPKLLQYISTLP